MSPDERNIPRPRSESPRILLSGAPLEQYQGGRRCAQVDCTALLSRYNPSDTCSQHEGWVDVGTRSFG